MHHSRLGGVIIDSRTEDLDGEARFWSEALGLPMRQSTNLEDENYVPLDAAARDLTIEVQRVSHPSRVHLDIEADDVEAEVRRLEKLGAKRVAQVRTWWVLEAPSGQRFCVVPAQGEGFAARATRWP
jgi:predicted enzyme related to lactoylglutathione lyase